MPGEAGPPGMAGPPGAPGGMQPLAELAPSNLRTLQETI